MGNESFSPYFSSFPFSDSCHPLPHLVLPSFSDLDYPSPHLVAPFGSADLSASFSCPPMPFSPFPHVAVLISSFPHVTALISSFPHVTVPFSLYPPVAMPYSVGFGVTLSTASSRPCALSISFSCPSATNSSFPPVFGQRPLSADSGGLPSTTTSSELNDLSAPP